MKRLIALACSVYVLFGATPAFAQQSETAASSSGSLLVILAAVAGGVAIFLLIIILFGSSRSRTEASVSTRLATYGATADGSSGLFSRFRLLRRAAKSAEEAAERRGATNKIEGALEAADLPLKAGEAIVGIIGLSLMAGIVAAAITQTALWGSSRVR